MLKLDLPHVLVSICEKKISDTPSPAALIEILLPPLGGEDMQCLSPGYSLILYRLGECFHCLFSFFYSFLNIHEAKKCTGSKITCYFN